MNPRSKLRLPPDLWAKPPKLAQALFSAMQAHIEELEARSIVAQGKLREPRRPGKPICGTDVDGGGQLSAAEASPADLPG